MELHFAPSVCFCDVNSDVTLPVVRSSRLGMLRDNQQCCSDQYCSSATFSGNWRYVSDELTYRTSLLSCPWTDLSHKKSTSVGASRDYCHAQENDIVYNNCFYSCYKLLSDT